jgi:hypothetical protein
VKSTEGLCVLLKEELAHDDIEVRTIQQLAQALIIIQIIKFRLRDL